MADEAGATLWFQQENNLLRRVLDSSLIINQIASITFDPELLLVAIFTGEDLDPDSESETVTVATRLGARGVPSDSVAGFFTTHSDGYDELDPGGDTIHEYKLERPSVASRAIIVMYTNGSAESFALTEDEMYLLV